MVVDKWVQSAYLVQRPPANPYLSKCERASEVAQVCRNRFEDILESHYPLFAARLSVRESEVDLEHILHACLRPSVSCFRIS